MENVNIIKQILPTMIQRRLGFEVTDIFEDHGPGIDFSVALKRTEFTEHLSLDDLILLKDSLQADLHLHLFGVSINKEGDISLEIGTY